VPEIMVYGQLSESPVFTPAVGRFAQRMICLCAASSASSDKKADFPAIHNLFRGHFVSEEKILSTRHINAEEFVRTDRIKLYITGSAHAEIINLVAVLDNLGKGVSGAAIQNLDL